MLIKVIAQGNNKHHMGHVLTMGFKGSTKKPVVSKSLPYPVIIQRVTVMNERLNRKIQPQNKKYQ